MLNLTLSLQSSAPPFLVSFLSFKTDCPLKLISYLNQSHDINVKHDFFSGIFVVKLS